MSVTPFFSLGLYEQFLYTLSDSSSAIQSSTLVLIRRGHSVATVRGELLFHGGVRLVVREQLLALEAVEIEDYGYEVWRDNNLLYWYDAQPHPMCLTYKAPIPTTSTSPRTVNTTASPRQT